MLSDQLLGATSILSDEVTKFGPLLLSACQPPKKRTNLIDALANGLLYLVA